MKRGRNDGHDSIEAELRGAYERGRRDQRGSHGGGAVPMLFMVGSAVVGAMLVYLALNRGALPTGWRLAHGSSSASHSGLTVVSDRAAAPVRPPRAAEPDNSQR